MILRSEKEIYVGSASSHMMRVEVVVSCVRIIVYSMMRVEVVVSCMGTTNRPTAKPILKRSMSLAMGRL